MSKLACLLVCLLVGQSSNLAYSADVGWRKFYVRDNRALGLGDCKATQPCQSEKTTLTIDGALDLPLSIILCDKDVPGAVDHLTIIEERYEDMSFVLKRFDHSDFETQVLEHSGSKLLGRDTFSFWWKLNEKGTWRFRWYFMDEYPARPSGFGKTEVQTVGCECYFYPGLKW